MLKMSGLSGLILLLIPVILSAQNSAGQVSISGHLRGLQGDSAILFAWDYNTHTRQNRIDTFYMMTKNDSLFFTGTVSGDKPARILVGGLSDRGGINFFLQPGHIFIKGDIRDPEKIQVGGTKDNEDFRRQRLAEAQVYALNVPLMQELRILRDTPDPDSARMHNLMSEITANHKKVKQLRLEFIREHPSSLASLTYLRVLEDDLSVEDFARLYEAFTPRLKETLAGHELKQKLAARYQTAIGQPAPLFSSTDVKGNSVHLVDFRGKYVLLEFWASWCVPCREEHPHLSSAYAKYRDSGFIILQYSIDEPSAMDKWKEAIQKDQLIWPQISDLSGFNSPVAKLYGVQPIPDNFLIDPSGIIVGRRLRGKALDQKLAEIFQGLQ